MERSELERVLESRKVSLTVKDVQLFFQTRKPNGANNHRSEQLRVSIIEDHIALKKIGMFDVEFSACKSEFVERYNNLVSHIQDAVNKHGYLI